MSYTGENLLLYFNLIAIATIGFAILGGFMKGFFKTTYYFIWTLVIFAGGFIAMPFITSYLMGVDLSYFNQYIPDDLGINLTTIKETVVAYLVENNPSLSGVLVEGNDALNMVYGIVQMVLNLVYIIVLSVLNLTIFKIVAFIIYLFVKPSKKDKYGNKRKKKRLLGATMGALRGVFAVILFAIPFSGVVSIGNSASFLIEQQDAYSVMMTAEGYGFVSEAEEIESNELIEFLKGYRSTYVGQVGAYIKINDVALDEYVFDEFFSVKTTANGKKTSVKFRQELDNVAKLYEKLMLINDNQTAFDESFLKKLTENDINEIFSYIENLDMIKVIIPIGIEYFVLSGEYDDVMTGYEDIMTVDKLKQIDLVQDIQGFKPIFTDLISLLDEDTTFENINFLTLDGTTVTRIFTNLGELNMINTLAPIMFNAMVSSDQMTEILTKYGLTKEDIILPTAQMLKADLINLGELYTAFQGLGFTSFDDFDNLSDPLVINAISDHSIEAFISSLFSFEVLSNNDLLITEMMYDLLFTSLPTDYQTLITKTDLSDNFNKTEITNIVLLAKILLSAGMIDENFTYESLLTTENIELLATRISESNLISTKMTAMIDLLTSQFNLPVTLTIPNDVTFSGVEGKTEIEALLNAMKTVLDTGILNDSFDFQSLSNEAIDALSLHLTSSKIINHNLSAIIDQTVTSAGFSYEVNLDGVIFDQLEVSSLLKSIKIILTKGTTIDAFSSLTNEEIKTISQSKVIANTIGTEIEKMTASGGSLYQVVYVPTTLTYYSTNDKIGELEHFLTALNEINVSGSLTNMDFDMNQLLDKNIDILFNSLIIEHTSVMIIKDLITTGALSTYIEPKLDLNTEYDWYIGEDNSSDTKDLINSIKSMKSIGINYDQMNYQAILTSLQNQSNVETLESALLDATILENSLEKMLNQLLVVEASFDIVINTNQDPNYFSGTAPSKGELYYLLTGLVSANELSSFDYLTLNQTNQMVFKTNLLEINDSDILRQLLIKLYDSSLLNSLGSYKVTPKPTLDKAMWITEINTLVDLFVMFNGGFDLTTLDITAMTDTEADLMGTAIKLLSKSYLLNVDQISTVIKSGFETVFNTTLSPLGAVYGGSNYSDKVAAWETEADILVQLIKDIDLITPISQTSVKGSYVGDTSYASSLGQFLDLANTSAMLSPVVIELAESFVDPAYHSLIDPTNYTYDEILVQIHYALWI